MRESPSDRTPLWWDQVDWGDPAPPLRGSAEADVAIIGAGYTGLSSALHLVKGGAKVAVLEAERVGYGASGRNGGIIGAIHAGRLRSEMRRLGRERFRRACEVGVSTVQAVEDLVREHGLECDFERAGEICLAHSARHLPKLQESAQVLSELGFPTSYLDRKALAAEMRTDLYLGAFLDQQAAHVHPGKYVYGLGRAARQRGVTIFENTRVTAFERDAAGGSARIVVRTAHGDVRARHVIIGTNGYTSTLHPFFAGRYYPLRSYIVATDPLSEKDWESLGWSHRRACYDTKIMLYYFRPTADRRIVFGGRADYAERENVAMYEHLEQAIGRVFPSVAGKYRVSHRWHGLLGFTFDRTPRVDRLPGLPEVWYSIGYSGHGVGVATFAGKVLASNLLGTREHDFVPWNRTPLRPFPLYPLRSITAPLYLAWCRFQDSL